MSPAAFKGDFTWQESLEPAAIDAAVAVMNSGRLHRYNTLGNALSETALLEEDYARWQQRRYCLACASGGYALHIALRAAGLQQGETVLSNAFTLSPVPGAILNAGGKVELIECTRDLLIDLDDLAARARSTGARFLLLSHMRGHQPNMDAVTALCEDLSLILIEDCAHTMGARWNQTLSGNFGHVACFSTQTYKHLNSGEGGLLVSDDAELAARAVLLSGAYMWFERHGAAPDVSTFESLKMQMPNFSGRMDNVRAAILRVQLRSLDQNIRRWNERHDALEAVLRGSPWLQLPLRDRREFRVGSSLQFRVEGLTGAQCRTFLECTRSLGVELKWFGDPNPVGFTANHHAWPYLNARALPQTDRVQAVLFDLRIPLRFSVADCEQIGRIIVHCVAQQMQPS